LAGIVRWAIPLLAVTGATLAGVRALRSRPTHPVHFETVAVERGAISARVTATGTTSALVTVLVGSQVSGRIETLGADFNSTVHRGQVVATIEASLFRAAVAQAQANWMAARASVETAKSQRELADHVLARAQRLFDEGLASRADLDAAVSAARVGKAQVAAAESAVAQAAAAREQAELNLKYTTVISPIDGVVISRNVDVGQTVAATLQAPTLFTIAQDLDRMQVDTNVAEADIGKVREAMAASFTVDAYPGKVFTGSVRQVRDAATTVQNVVTYDAVIDVDNRERLLKPGMTASATFVYAERADVLRVPNAALRFKPDAATIALMSDPDAGAPVKAVRADQRVVWVTRGERAEPKLIVIGISDGTATEVVSGDVHPGDVAVAEAVAAAPGSHP
jgi:HlyD family secretion protein